MEKLKKTEKKEVEQINIKAPNIAIVRFKIRGDSPYVQNKFSQKSLQQMKEQQERGPKANKKPHEAKDFEELYKGAMYFSEGEKWNGIPAAAFRSAMIRAGRIGREAAMTDTRCTLFVVADGFDYQDSTPLVKITKGEPHRWDAYVRLQGNKTDIHPRPMWNPGWEAVVTIKYDSDFLSAESVCNLLNRAGIQVGVGEGRPFSKTSDGLGFGTFEIIGGENE